MATWHGWDAALLAALGAPQYATNLKFLDEWSRMDGTTCAYNPLGATLATQASSRCRHVTGGVYVQAYRSREAGLAATVQQLKEHRFAAILAALKSGTPTLDTDWPLVVGALGTWGAHRFAVRYEKEAQDAQGVAPPSGPPAGTVTSSLGAWHELTHTLAVTVPAEIHRTQRLAHAAVARIHGGR